MNKLTLAILSTTTIFVLSACATGPSTIALSDTTSLSNSANKIISIDEALPGLTVTEPSSAAFGAIGAIAAVSKGAKLVEEYNIPSPNLAIETALRNAVAQKYGLSISNDHVDYTDTKKPKEFLQKDNHIVVDSGINTWGYTYYPTSWGRYRVFLNVTMQLVDGNKGELMAAHKCVKFSHTEAKDSPTNDELFENDAIRLKAEISKMADLCAQEFITEILETNSIES